ncbi:hypothetical protein [Kitasatospora sp. NBC_01300]|uniref:hypothetical protein n=1 Tax=Kitasatospora sp. NBC_01300 TaxID=2903574 RepID=UPI00352F8DB4|nr:hypothetical protein OG556_16455 [Kitasatospora sp. NBC_01300]
MVVMSGMVPDRPTQPGRIAGPLEFSVYPFPKPQLPTLKGALLPSSRAESAEVGRQLAIDGTAMQLLRSSEGWAFRVGSVSTVAWYGPAETVAQAEDWMARYAAWCLWPRARARGPWGCLARVREGWVTALAHTGLPPEVETHVGVQDAEEHVARHLIAPAVWSAAQTADLPPGIRAVETQFWVREGYRVLATWASTALGALTRNAHRKNELGRGNYSTTDLAERLGISHATISGAAAGRSWNPQINKAVGALASRIRPW